MLNSKLHSIPYRALVMITILVSASGTAEFTLLLLHNEPYVIQDTHLPGIVPEQMSLLMEKTKDINIKTRTVSWTLKEAKTIIGSGNPLEMIREKENITGQNIILGTWNFHYQEKHGKFLAHSVVHSPGLLTIVHRDTIGLAVKLYSGMSHTILILYNGVLVAAFLGITVWWMERRTNPMFSDKLSEGILAGLWFGIVTMTSVGYGDYVPRQKISKVLCLIFMLMSTLIVAALTSTYTEHLANNNLDMSNMRLSVVDGSRGLLIARQFKRYKDEHTILKGENFHDALRLLNKKEVEGTIIDYMVGAWQKREINNQELRIIMNIKKEFDVSIFVYNDTSNAADVKLLLDSLKAMKHNFNEVADNYAQTVELVTVDSLDGGYAFRRFGTTQALSLTVAILLLLILVEHLVTLFKRRKRMIKNEPVDTVLRELTTTKTNFSTLEDLEQRLDSKLQSIKEEILNEYGVLLQHQQRQGTILDDIPKDVAAVVEENSDGDHKLLNGVAAEDFGNRVVEFSREDYHSRLP